MSLDEHFIGYMTTVYPDCPDPKSEQYQQLRDAFFAGCLIAYNSKDDFTLDLEYRHRELKAGLFREPEFK